MDDRSKQQVRIPVRLHDGGLTRADGQEMPRLKSSVSCELVVPLYAFEDAAERARHMAVDKQPVLQRGALLAAKIRKDWGLPGALAPLVLTAPREEDLRGMAGYVPIILTQVLHLVTGGGRQPRLDSVDCIIPSLGLRASSVNEAYTLISRHFEPARRSHTGNVFHRVAYSAEGERWLPLDEVRQGVPTTSPGNLPGSSSPPQPSSHR